MKLSPVGAKLIQQFESCRLKAYWDAHGKVWTIGWGHTGADVKADDNWTQEQADAAFYKDVAWASQCVNEGVTVPLTQGQFDALVSIVFNVGPGNDAKSGIIRLRDGSPSTLLRLLNTMDYAGAAAQFEQWISPGTDVTAGLLRRRKVERALFENENNLPTQIAPQPVQIAPQPPPIAPQPVKGKPMFPFLAALLPALIDKIPDLIKIVGDKSADVSTRNTEAVVKIFEMAKTVTGQPNEQAAVEAIQKDPAVAQKFNDEIRKEWFDLSQRSISDARVFAMASAQEVKVRTVLFKFTFIELLSLLMLFIGAAGGWFVLASDSMSAEMKGSVITLVLIAGFSGVKEFWLGSSEDSRKKTDLLGQR